MSFLKKRNEESARRDQIITYKRVFGSPEGKEVLYDIMNKGRVIDTVELTPFQQGKRALALEIARDCGINLTEFDKMMKGEE